MVKLITTLLMLALVGCATDVAPGNGVEATPELAIEMWAGEALPEACSVEASRIKYYETDIREVHRLCENTEAVGCYLHDVTMSFVDGDGEKANWVVMTPGDEHTRAHELVHWLMWCSGVGGGVEHHHFPEFVDTLEGMKAVM